jgi:carbohydrate-binding DOMON domain-containing protein
MGNIDKLVVIDQGSGGGGTSNSVARLANTAPAVVFNLLQQLEALGLNVPSLLDQLGLPRANGSQPPAVVESSIEKQG